MRIFRWLNPFKHRHNSAGAKAPARPMTERERAILERELRDSARNAMGSPLDMTSSGDGMMGKSANIALNPAIRGDSSWNVGIPSQSLDETKGK
jgi:hypothetical protein